MGIDHYHQVHPTQKPLDLMKNLIRMTTSEGDLILDPFCGSATTLAAAKELNREGIGIELNPEYFQIAVKRLSLDVPPRWDAPTYPDDEDEPIPPQILLDGIPPHYPHHWRL